jgi:hypothetical protein
MAQEQNSTTSDKLQYCSYVLKYRTGDQSQVADCLATIAKGIGQDIF